MKMERMKHKCKLSSSADQDNSNDPPRKQAKIFSTAVIENKINGNSAQCSNSLGTDGIYQIVGKSNERDEVQIAIQNKETIETNMLDSVRALLTCAVCLEVDNHSNQCTNGHIICSSCSLRLIQQSENCRPKCPSCRTSLRQGLRRCLLAEQLADELPTQCYHCKEKVLRRHLHNHEVETCPKRPALCRFHLVGCTWHGLGNEVDKHATACHYRLKTLGEIEPLLVDNVLGQVAYNTETRLFTNGLLYLLKKSPYGLNIYQRQVGVFRDALDNASQTHRYTSENSLLQCSGLRKVLIEVGIDLVQGKLQYQIFNKSEGKACISVRLCSAHCGDVEFHVHDQIRNVNFDNSLRETPKYSALITYSSGRNNNQQDRRRLDSLIFKHDLMQLRPNVMQKSSLLVLEFILLCHRPKIMGSQLDGGDLHNNTAVLTSPFEATVMHNLDSEVDTTPEAEGAEESSQQETRVASPQSSLRSFLREMVHSPGSNILRPLIGLISSQSATSPVNNNAQGTQNSRPRTTVITVTNLNRRGASNLRRTNVDEDDEDEDGLDSEESTTEGNQEESIDSSSDDDDDENTLEPNIRLRDGQLEDRNNNALTKDEPYHSQGEAQHSNTLNEDMNAMNEQPCSSKFYIPCRCYTNCYDNTIANDNNSSINNQLQGGQQNYTVDEQSNSKRNIMKRNRRETTKSPSAIIRFQTKRARHTHTEFRAPKSRFTKTSARRRTAIRHGHTLELASSQTTQDSIQIEPGSSDSLSHEITENIVNTSSNDTCCRTPLWLEKVLRTVSQVTRYFIRSHLLMSLNDSVVPPQTDDMHAAADSLPKISHHTMETITAQTSLKPSPSLDSSSTLRMSLRGDIPGEIVRLARTIVGGLVPVKPEQVSGTGSVASTLSVNSNVGSIPTERNAANNTMNDGATEAKIRRRNTVYRNKRKQR